LDDSAFEATHLLIRSTAYPIGDGVLNLSFGTTRSLEIIEESSGDRADFALRRTGGGLRLEWDGDLDVLVNDRSAESGTRLHSGDRIATSGSGEEARLITVRGDGS